MRNLVILASLLLLLGCKGDEQLASIKAKKAKPYYPVEESLMVAPTLTIDKIYRSMQGPGANDYVAIDPNRSELAWLTGFKVNMVEADGVTPSSDEFMCHSNLNLVDRFKHDQRVSKSRINMGRLFTISQGLDEVKFPDGFGIPVLTNEPLNVSVQALNLNGVEQPRKVRHKVALKYVNNKDVPAPMVPLFASSITGLKTLEGGTRHYGVADPDPHMQLAGCSPGGKALDHDYFTDRNGNKFTSHWVLPPGKEENHTLVTEMLALPYDTTIHYISVHYHAYCEWAELRDLTTGEVLFRSNADQYPNKAGLLRTENFASPEGIPVFKDHDYELVSSYNNTTEEELDAMVVFFLYLKDKEFTAPPPEAS